MPLGVLAGPGDLIELHGGARELPQEAAAHITARGPACGASSEAIAMTISAMPSTPSDSTRLGLAMPVVSAWSQA